jgi:hypothetical protein
MGGPNEYKRKKVLRYNRVQCVKLAKSQLEAAHPFKVFSHHVKFCDSRLTFLRTHFRISVVTKSKEEDKQ